MLEVMISWIYLGIICIIVGYGVGKLLDKVVHIGQQSLMQCMVTGIVGITVYTEYLSIIYKIGALAQAIVLIICFMIIVIYRRQLALRAKKLIHQMVSWEGIFYLLLAIFFAFFVSRGEFHTDTNIYHAANIRIYEEVGLIKGMTNLQWNFGYNSAALAFAAFFSLGWLLPQPLHVTTGFFELIFAVYACHHLKNWRVHKNHLGDACCIAIWVYILVILVRSMSPATDFVAMLLVLYGITAWIINCESKKNISEYAMLSVLMVYALTVKLSAGCMVLIAIYPFIMLIKQKKVKTILGYILMGIIVLMPYLIRNYYLSGWLIYPFAAIDIFNPDWKVPLSTLQRDSAFIKVYGRCVYDPEKVNMPIKGWVRIWWAGQRYYERLLIMSVFLSSVLIFIHELYRLIRGKIEWDRTFMYLAIWASALLWFIEAPFIRYGLAFLLSIPLLAAGICVDAHKCGFRRIVLGITLLMIFLMYTPYVDNYFQDFGVFVKHGLKSGYYLVQKDYDVVPTDSQQVGPFTFQFPSKGETNSYYAFPGVAYSDRLFEIEARGDTLRDGFRHK